MKKAITTSDNTIKKRIMAQTATVATVDTTLKDGGSTGPVGDGNNGVAAILQEIRLPVPTKTVNRSA